MPARGLTILGYAALAALLVGAELVARWRPDAMASASAVLRGVCRTRAGQLSLLLWWWWLGWHFLLAG